MRSSFFPNESEVIGMNFLKLHNKFDILMSYLPHTLALKQYNLS